MNAAFRVVVVILVLIGTVRLDSQIGLGINLKFPDGTTCTITIATLRETPAGQADMQAVADALKKAFDESQDMKDKVAEACKVWKGQIGINVLRDDPGFDSAGVEPDTGRMVIDIGDVEVERRHVDGSGEAVRNYRESDLSATIAHEFEHLKDGPGETAHRDPGSDCSATTTGPAVDDENTVLKQMGYQLVRTHYGDEKTGTITYTFGRFETLVRDFWGLRQELRGLPPVPKPPPAPNPGSAGTSSISDTYFRNFPSLDDIPDAPCDGHESSGCYPVPLQTDRDLDGVPDRTDNCPGNVNPQQADANRNRIGDDCERGFRQCSGGGLFTRPLTYGVIAGGGLLPLLLGGRGDGTPTQASTTPTGFTLFVVISFIHLSGGGSMLIGEIVPTPGQPLADYTVQTMGPGVISSQPVTGRLDPSGRATFQVPINLVGTYTSIITVVSTTGVRSSVTVTTTVT